MGLTINPGDIDFAYGEFARFREHLAAGVQINLRDMRGFGGLKSWDDVETPLKPLLDHSDCAGVLLPWQCESMIPTLESICDQWFVRSVPNTETAGYVTQLRRLINGMKHCVEHGCAMVFS